MEEENKKQIEIIKLLIMHIQWLLTSLDAPFKIKIEYDFDSLNNKFNQFSNAS